MKINCMFYLFIPLSICLTLPLKSQIKDPVVEVIKSNNIKGYFLLSPFKMKKEGKKSASKGLQLILNQKGEIICYRNIETGSDFKMHANGKYSYWNRDKFFILDPTFTLCDSVACVNDIKTDSHDFLILSNGNYLLIGKDAQTADFSEKKIFKNQTLTGSKKMIVRYDVIQELTPDKKLVFQWSSRPFFKPEDADPCFYSDSASIDVTHFNSVDVDKNGDLLISTRYFHQVIKVRKSDGQIIWRMGGKNGDIQISNDALPFYGQHDARYTRSGRITLFDNGFGSDSLKHNARALEYIIDDHLKTARVTWNYHPDKKIVSDAAGNVNRYENMDFSIVNYGNIEGLTAPNTTFEIVDKEGELLERIYFKDTCASYRTFFYPKLSFKIKQPALKLIQRNGKTVVTTEKPFKHYLWSNGERTPEVEFREGTDYYAFVSDDGLLFTRSKTKENKRLTALQTK